MRQPHVYLTDVAAHQKYTIEPAKSHHLIKVLRLGKGDLITVFDGRGNAYLAIIEVGDKQQVVISTTNQLPSTSADSKASVHVGQVFSTASKMDWIVEKATELGVSTLTPITYSENKVRTNVHNRWQRLMIAASEQCGRYRLPQLNEPCDLAKWGESLSSDEKIRILLSPRAIKPLGAVLSESWPLVLLIGGESGFSLDQERDWQDKHHFKLAHLGPRILRTETAALAALAIISSAY